MKQHEWNKKCGNKRWNQNRPVAGILEQLSG
jgi:hypothetical protein